MSIRNPGTKADWIPPRAVVCLAYRLRPAFWFPTDGLPGPEVGHFPTLLLTLLPDPTDALPDALFADEGADGGA
ncbi:hypothetical protein [Paradesulfitobacterium aromaticivorans]